MWSWGRRGFACCPRHGVGVWGHRVAPPREPFVPLLEVSGQPIHVVDRGAGDAVVLLHAFPLQAAMWDYQLEALEGTHRCLAIDLPGFGQSPGPTDPGGVTMQGWAGLVDGVLDQLGIAQATIVGASLGGYLAMALLRHHRARVAQLVLVGTRARADELATIQRRTSQQDELWAGSEVGSLAKGMVGELDRVTPIAEAMSLRSLLKGDLVVVPNVGHLPNLEDPLAFNDALVAFLESSK